MTDPFTPDGDTAPETPPPARSRASFLAALAAGATPAEATRLANYGGGIVVMKLGTATVAPEELREAVRRDLGKPDR